MKIVDIIENKRDGLELSGEEIDFFVSEFMQGRVSDAQAGAFVMAITEKGFSPDEAYFFSNALALSGKTFNVSSKFAHCVDKHSTGGVSDSATLIVVPVLASLGLKVAKLSTRGFGASIGTLDRLGVFDGYKPNMVAEDFLSTLEKVGASIIGENSQIVPADKKFYEIRRQTGTIPSVPLIACSIMCKKIVMGADALVLDVKCGEGSLVQDIAQAESLAKLMVQIGKRAGIKTTAILSNLNQPLGRTIGPSLEAREAVLVLLADPSYIEGDLYKMCREMVSHILISTGTVAGRGAAYEKFDEVIKNGSALKKFKEMVAAHGGNTNKIDNPDLLIPTSATIHINAEKSGIIFDIDTKGLYQAVNIIGGGRSPDADTKLNTEVGIEVFVREGDRVKEGDTIATVHYSMSDPSFASAIAIMRKCFTISKQAPEIQNLIYKVIV